MIRQVPLVMQVNGLDAWAVRKRVSGFSLREGMPRLWDVTVAASVSKSS
jgi:peptide/nickel transport system substrate-binding protein